MFYLRSKPTYSLCVLQLIFVTFAPKVLLQKRTNTMKKFLLVLSLVCIAFLSGCSNDSDSTVTPEPEEPVAVKPAVTTLEPVFSAQKIRFRGNITNQGDNGYRERGVCWSNNANPLKGSENYVVADGSGTGEYFADYNLGLGRFTMGETYNIRAFVVDHNGETIYGNNLSMTLPNSFTVTLLSITDIITQGAILKANVLSNSVEFSTVPHKGFLISTNSTPTVDNTTVNEDTTNSLGDFQLTAGTLSPNTTYYARAYAYNNSNNIIYSNITTFKTTGYRGASGGYVFYDKGTASDGWRYLEVSPTELRYNNSTQIKFGCTGTSVFQTQSSLGSGKINTAMILSACNEANCAARVCDNYSVNGLDDWYLPSRDELAYIYTSLNSLMNLGTSTNQVYWSSTEYDGATAFVYNLYYGFGPAFGVSKSNNGLVLAVRQF